MLLPEEVRIGEARHVSPLGEIRMELIRIEMCVTCHQGRGPYTMEWEKRMDDRRNVGRLKDIGHGDAMGSCMDKLTSGQGHYSR